MRRHLLCHEAHTTAEETLGWILSRDAINSSPKTRRHRLWRRLCLRLRLRQQTTLQGLATAIFPLHITFSSPIESIPYNSISLRNIKIHIRWFRTTVSNLILFHWIWLSFTKFHYTPLIFTPLTTNTLHFITLHYISFLSTLSLSIILHSIPFPI